MLLIRGDSADWQQRVVKHPEIMSDRFHSLAVVLEKDIRDDDAKQKYGFEQPCGWIARSPVCRPAALSQK